MKSLKSFFDHRRAHESVEEIWLPLFLTLAATLLPFLLVAPVASTVACIFLFSLSLLLRVFKLSLYAIPAYLIGLAVLMALKSSLPHGMWSHDFFATIWIVFAICKSFRLKKYGDGEVLLILTLAGNACILLIDDSVTITVWTTVMAIIAMGQLLRLNIKDVSSVTLLASLKSAALMTVYALPLLTLLFYMFHRASTYHLTWKNRRTWSGLSGVLEPGRVSKLTLNTAPAFRAKLDRPLPALMEPYWRAATLGESQGLVWRSPSAPSKHDFVSLYGGGPCLISQTIYPQQGSISTFKVGFDRPIRPTLTGENPYKLTSRICGWHDQLANDERAQDTTIHFTPSGRLNQLVAKLKASSPADVWKNILHYYKHQDFHYTLLTDSGTAQMSLDQFLFDKKAGFCEHFAAATATLLRLAGVPSRVVIGFAGGDYNPVGGYWLVSYADAHAWVEMWTDERGWERLDPASAISPPPPRHHALEFLNWAGQASDAFFFSISTFLNNRERIFSLNEFTFDWWLALSCLFLLFLSLQLKKWLRPQEKVVIEDFEKLCGLFAERGLPRRRSEGYADYRQRALSWLEQSGPTAPVAFIVDQLFSVYIRFRYGPDAYSADDLKLFCQEIRRVQRNLRWKTSYVARFFQAAS